VFRSQDSIEDLTRRERRVEFVLAFVGDVVAVAVAEGSCFTEEVSSLLPSVTLVGGVDCIDSCCDIKSARVSPGSATLMHESMEEDADETSDEERVMLLLLAMTIKDLSL